MTVVLIGAPAVGKSVLGRAYAEREGLRFGDSDRLFVSRDGPIAAFFRLQGEKAFRAIERDIVASAIERFDVVSRGGGAILDARTRRSLAVPKVVVVLVEADEDVVAARIEGRGDRPLIDGIATWRRMLAARRPLYEELADVRVHTSGEPLDDAVATLRAALAAHAGADDAPERVEGDR